jgi:cytochrome c oxidase assembly factor 2
MPPHLHPRSSATTTLFASTLAASFIIVGIPHVFPCPAPRRGYLDEDGKIARRRRRRRKQEDDPVDDADMTEVPGRQLGTENAQVGLGGELKSLLGISSSGADLPWVGRTAVEGSQLGKEERDLRDLFRDMKEEEAAMEKERRECPVPKPKGRIGELLGFGRDGKRWRAEDDT